MQGVVQPRSVLWYNHQRDKNMKMCWKQVLFNVTIKLS